MLREGVGDVMPSFLDRLSDDELRAVAQYVESVAGENPEVASDPR
jgi:mono/diheme cytochrome c family protein